MSELLEQILNDSSARDGADLPALASNLAEEQFLPWAGKDQ